MTWEKSLFNILVTKLFMKPVLLLDTSRLFVASRKPHDVLMWFVT